MKTKNKTSVSYEEGLLARLRNHKYASEYLNSHLETDPFDPKAFLLALRDVAFAFGISDIALETGLGRESLYKALSKAGNPKLSTLSAVLSVMGLKIKIVDGQGKNRRTKRRVEKKTSAA